MIRNALGLIETVGLAAGLEAADAAVKAANVKLLGYELTKGGGMVTIKLSGDVGAVKAAVEAGSQAASKVNKVYATHVIPRPHQELDCMVSSKENIGTEEPAPVVVPKTPVKPAVTETAVAKEPVPAEPEPVSEAVQEPASEQEPESESVPVPVPAKDSAEICNLCNDPACSRKKGEPRTTCLHYSRLEKE
ncbi:MAG TPA: BMC domain-containing protein [Patescibacteria group bacterium]|nr:BMC domain-containing protein [Patescibacteria group bacterium]